MSWAVRITHGGRLTWRWNDSTTCYIMRDKNTNDSYCVYQWKAGQPSQAIEVFKELATAKTYVRMVLSGEPNGVVER
jgi:hypothetical protein